MTTRTRTYFIFAAAIALLDVVGKWWAITSLPHEDEVAFRSIFTFALHKNPGIAFDIPIPFLVIAPLTLAIMGGLVWFTRHEWNASPIQATAALAIIFGALNNLIDRAMNGFTTDYLIIFSTSAINLSDILILSGAVVLLRYTKENPNARTS